MLEIRELKCPNCGAPADAEGSTCPYCYAKIPHAGAGEVGQVVVAIIIASIIAMFAADYFLDTGLSEWIMEAWRRLSGGAPPPP